MRALGSRIVLLAGLAVSELCTIIVGRRNPSLLLMVLFIAWVASPYFALWRLSRRATPARDWLLLGVVILSTAVYVRVAVGHIPAKPAFPFLAVPAALWLIALLLGFLGTRRS